MLVLLQWRSTGGIIEVLGPAHHGSGIAVPVRVYVAVRNGAGISFINRTVLFKTASVFEDFLPGPILFSDDYPDDQSSDFTAPASH